MAMKVLVLSPDPIVAEEKVFDLINQGFEAHSANIRYDILHGLPRIEDTDKFPLILSGTFQNRDMKIHVYSVTVGYGLLGPHAMVDILRFAGFEFDENDILTNRKANYNNEVILYYTR